MIAAAIWSGLGLVLLFGWCLMRIADDKGDRGAC